MEIWHFIEEVRRRLHIRGGPARDADALLPPTNSTQDNLFDSLPVIPWRWCALNAFKLIQQYPSGITWTILLSELQLMWNDASAEWFRQTRSSKNQIIETILDSGKLAPSQMLELTIVSVSLLPNTTSTYVVNLSDGCSKRLIQSFLHQKLKRLLPSAATDRNPWKMFRVGRKLRLVNCRLHQFPAYVTDDRPAKKESELPRLLPTHYVALVIENEKDAQDVFKQFTVIDKDLSNLADKLDLKIVARVRRAQTPALPIDQAKRAQQQSRFKTNGDTFGSASSITRRIELISTHAPPQDDQAEMPTFKSFFLAFHGTEEAAMADFFSDGDIVAIMCKRPDSFPSTTQISYDPDMLIVIHPGAKHDDDVPISFTAPMGTSQTSQWKVPRDKRGVRNYAYYPESVSMATLKEREATNFSFLGRVLTVTRNRPLVEPGAAQRSEPHIRHGLIVAAVTGAGDAPQPPYLEVTLWDSVAKEHCSIQVGQIVYIHSMTTTSPTTNKPSDRIIANASPRLGSEIINVSELSGLLSPKLLRLSSSLADCQKRGWAACISDVYVTLKKCETFQIHLRCRRAVVEKKADSMTPPPMQQHQLGAKPSYHPQPYPQRMMDNSSRFRSESPNQSLVSPSPPSTPLSKFWCGFCDCTVSLSELDHGYSISWMIQDQAGTKMAAVASPAINERLLMMPAREFVALSTDAQFDHTSQFCMPPGMSIRALLTIATPNGELLARIESFTDDPPPPGSSDSDTIPPPSFASSLSMQ